MQCEKIGDRSYIIVSLLHFILVVKKLVYLELRRALSSCLTPKILLLHFTILQFAEWLEGSLPKEVDQ